MRSEPSAPTSPFMRETALNCDIQKVKALADAPKEAEHREKYSMGAGYCLKEEKVTAPAG